VNLSLVEIRTFPDGVLLTRYETRRRLPSRYCPTRAGARSQQNTSTRIPSGSNTKSA
jgi:hypothetical protein